MVNLVKTKNKQTGRIFLAMKCILVSVVVVLLLCVGRTGGLLRGGHARSFFATTIGGMEPVLAKELKSLSDISGVKLGRGGVEFEGSSLTGLEGLLWLRTPLKLMERMMVSNDIRDKGSLYDWISRNDWTETISPQQTLKCDVVMGRGISPELSHNHFTALTIKNAIVDQFRHSYQVRPSVDLDDPDLPLLLYLHENKGTLYRVWSGEASLHKRGYRPGVMDRAALRETTAAALLLSTEWLELARKSGAILCDPMCGSGTIAIEAALMAADTAPGLIRYASALAAAAPLSAPASTATPAQSMNSDPQTSYVGATTTAPGGRHGTRMDYSSRPASDSGHTSSGAHNPSSQGRPPVPLRWLDTAKEAAPLWDKALSAARARDQRHTSRGSSTSATEEIRILANDHHAGSIALAKEAAQRAGVDHLIEFSCTDIARYSPTREVSLLVTNPPWEKRLEDGQQAWEKLASFMQSHCQSSASPPADDTKTSGLENTHISGGAWVLSGNPELERTNGLDRPTRSVPLRVATVDAQFNRYEVQ